MTVIGRRLLLLSLSVLVLGVFSVVFWRIGSPLSEETSYRLAADEATKYASARNFSLSGFAPPRRDNKAQLDLYTYTWVSSDRGPLTITVDPRRVEVTVVQEPARVGK